MHKKNKNYIILFRSFLKLKSFCETEGFKGWDPFDGLNSWAVQNTVLGHYRIIRLAWIQFFKRSPINLRPLLGVKKDYNPKGLGLFLIGYCNLYKAGPKDEYYKKIVELSNLLVGLRSNGYSGACWGYNFDWQARAFFQPKHTPNVVATSYIVESLLNAYEITKQEDLLSAAKSSIKFVLEDLNKSYDKDGDFTLSYSPLDHTQVYNAGLLGAKILCLVYTYTKEERLLQNAGKIVNYVSKRQKENGSWSYGTLPFHQWIDSFHTGYNLECIYLYQQTSLDYSYKTIIEKGTDFYLNTFFTRGGISKYYSHSIYPIDVHSPSQLIVTLYKLNMLKKKKGLSEKVLKWTVKNMQSPKGFFYYQKNRIITNKIPYIRWAQAWMFYSYSYYFLDNNPNE